MAIDYTKLLPPPPDGLVEEILRQGAFKGTDRVIYKCEYVYNPLTGRKEKMAKCVCTACGDVWYEGWAENYGIYTCEKHIKDKTKMECPNCHSKVTLLHSSHIVEHSCYNNTEWISVFGRIGNKFTVSEYIVIQQFSKNGSKKYVVRNYNAYVFETDRRCAMLQGYRKNINSVTFLEKWWQKSRCSNISDATKYVYPYDKDFTQGTVVENSRLDKYLSCGDELHPVNYLRWWQRQHKIETLMDIGLEKMIHKELIGFNTNRYCNDVVSQLMLDFNWKEKSPFKITGFDRNEMRLVKKYGLSYREVVRFRNYKSNGIPFTDENVLLLLQWSETEVERLNDKGVAVLKTLKYLGEQKKSVSYYLDYIDMAVSIGLDRANPVILFPKNLQHKHDDLVMKIKWNEDEKLKETFHTLADILEEESYNDGDMLLRPARSEKELIVEGKLLKHCVGGYGKSHCEGRSIFFIRKAEEPEKPWYTLQVDLKKGEQLQLHGYENDKNNPVPQKVKDFVTFWLENIFRPFDVKTMKFIEPKTAATA
ncbi:MAG: PcfJ domain-containing protein [Oscillospiraceae bacterium]|nr:PcfJ domain-containing protein [Oscillospiraceae bacterium]